MGRSATELPIGRVGALGQYDDGGGGVDFVDCLGNGLSFEATTFGGAVVVLGRGGVEIAEVLGGEGLGVGLGGDGSGAAVTFGVDGSVAGVVAFGGGNVGFCWC